MIKRYCDCCGEEVENPGVVEIRKTVLVEKADVGVILQIYNANAKKEGDVCLTCARKAVLLSFIPDHSSVEPSPVAALSLSPRAKASVRFLFGNECTREEFLGIEKERILKQKKVGEDTWLEIKKLQAKIEADDEEYYRVLRILREQKK